MSFLIFAVVNTCLPDIQVWSAGFAAKEFPLNSIKHQLYDHKPAHEETGKRKAGGCVNFLGSRAGEAAITEASSKAA